MAAGADQGRSGDRQRSVVPASRARVGLLLAALVLFWAPINAGGSSLGFDIHHRFSDPVRSIFPAGDGEILPEKGSVDYFAVMAERDRIHGRRLTSGTSYDTPLTFAAGNTTYSYPQFGYLYFANVSIGTPGVDFLVALDTGSNLFWLPCDCISCVTSIETSSSEIKFNMYELKASSTGRQVPCASPLCDHTVSCLAPNQCPYYVAYMSANTSTSGYLVEDVLHLTTDSNPSKNVDATITFGCGQRQTGSLLKGGAPNGLLGLGLDQISVPSTLAQGNVTANSFSMCFARGGVGRISFGDKGSSDQAETPFVSQPLQPPSYFVAVTQVVVGGKTSQVETAVVFDTGTSFTLFTDPIYTIITEAFDSQVQEKRFAGDPRIPFEFCYEMSSCSSSVSIPSINLTMKGGAEYNVLHPLLLVITGAESCVYCLTIIKEDTVNVIGENFMSGYRMVFNNEKSVLGWKESKCDYAFETKTRQLPTSNGNISKNSGAAPTTMGNQQSHFKHWSLALSLLVLQFFATL